MASDNAQGVAHDAQLEPSADAVPITITPTTTTTTSLHLSPEDPAARSAIMQESLRSSADLMSRLNQFVPRLEASTNELRAMVESGEIEKVRMDDDDEFESGSESRSYSGSETGSALEDEDEDGDEYGSQDQETSEIDPEDFNENGNWVSPDTPGRAYRLQRERRTREELERYQRSLVNSGLRLGGPIPYMDQFDDCGVWMGPDGLGPDHHERRERLRAQRVLMERMERRERRVNGGDQGSRSHAQRRRRARGGYIELELGLGVLEQKPERDLLGRVVKRKGKERDEDDESSSSDESDSDSDGDMPRGRTSDENSSEESDDDDSSSDSRDGETQEEEKRPQPSTAVPMQAGTKRNAGADNDTGLLDTLLGSRQAKKRHVGIEVVDDDEKI